jgi:hypothetical protein
LFPALNAWVQFLDSAYGIFGKQCDSGAEFSPQDFDFLLPDIITFYFSMGGREGI